MSKPRGASAPMRMGMVNILMMVIALCLVVFAVLSLATAQAGATLSQRQAANVRESYAVEAQAQRFLAEVDEVLSSLIAGETPPERIMDGITRGAEGYVSMRERMTDGLEPGIGITVEELTSVEMHEAIGHVTGGRTLGALKARFVGPSGHCLDALIAINEDGSYSIMQWKATKLWEDDAHADRLLHVGE